MSDETQVSLTVTVTPEKASYILSLISLWSNDEIDLNSSIRLLPALVRDIALEIDACADFNYGETIDSLEWTKRDVETINALLLHENLIPIPSPFMVAAQDHGI